MLSLHPVSSASNFGSGLLHNSICGRQVIYAPLFHRYLTTAFGTLIADPPTGW